MNETAFEQWERQVRQAAQAMAYPATPDLAASLPARLQPQPLMAAPRLQRRPARRLAWVVVFILLLLGTLLAVPQVRAALFEFFQIGAIRIFTGQAPAISPATATADAAVPGALSPGYAPLNTTARPSPALLRSVLKLSGETTLAEAQRQSGLPALRRPTYPEAIGPPDRVFYQDVAGPVVILVWLEPGTGDQVRLALYALALEGQAFGGKFQAESVAPAEVNGGLAYWVTGEHALHFFDANGRPDFNMSRLVEGNVLIWVEDGVTYRLESALPLAEAIRIAESLE